MRYIITAILLQFALISSAQTEASKLSIGLISKVDVFQTDLNNWYRFHNHGIAGSWAFSDKWKMNFNSLISSRKYGFQQRYWSLPIGVVGAPNSYLNRKPITRAKELLLELENNMTYFLNTKRVSPFFGLGYALQIPISTEGEIVYGQNDERNMNIPEDVKPAVKFGIHLLTGIKFSLGKRMSVLPGLEFKYFTNSNADIYQYDASRYYTTISGYRKVNRDLDHSFLFSLNLLYRLKKI